MASNIRVERAGNEDTQLGSEASLKRSRTYVVGFYDKGSLGDEAFRPAFAALWGNRTSFTFGESVPDDIAEYDACIIGGGSFLDYPIEGVERLGDVPTALVGIGWGPLHPANAEALKRARIIVTRNNSHPTIDNYVSAPDLVFARDDLQLFPQGTPYPRDRVLIIGNRYVVPNRQEPSWKHLAWDWFATEFAKSLDRLLLNGSEVRFFCFEPRDLTFAYGIMARMMSDRAQVTHIMTETKLLYELSTASLVVSLRFHGLVFAAMLKRPFIGIAHHDKLWEFFKDNNLNSVTDYYGYRDKHLHQAMLELPTKPQLDLLAQSAKARWAVVAPLVAQELGF